MSGRVRHGFLHDEQGDKSTARALLWVITPNILAMLWAAAILGPQRFAIPAGAYALLGTMFTLPCIWAGGRAMMRYVGPQFGRSVGSIARGAQPNQPNQWASGDPDEGIA